LKVIKNIGKLFLINSLCIAAFWCFSTAKADPLQFDFKKKYYPPNLRTSLNEAQWRLLYADSVLKTLSLEEKVGQLFMVSAYSNKEEKYYQKLEVQIRKYHLGGLIFFQGDPLTQANLTNRYQAVAKFPLLIGLDAEWGLGMRLSNSFSFPKAITMGATNDHELVEKCAAEMGRQCKRLGVHFNFAPDADVNTNPQNPVINFRSFGSSSEKVSLFSRAFVRGLKKYNVLSSAKHFPGHGDTQDDSHVTMPRLNGTKAQIIASELIPFKDLILDSISSIMVGHLSVPAFDPRPNMPASISEPIIKGLLKGELLYSGLVISDALNMQGLVRMYPTGQAEIMAFKAGNDVLLQTANIDISYPAILAKFKEKNIPIADLDYSVRKILMAKKWAGILETKPHVVTQNLIQDLNPPYAEYLKQEVFNKAVTIVKDNQKLLPLNQSSGLRVASLAISPKEKNTFQKALSIYGHSHNFEIKFKPSEQKDNSLILTEVTKSDVVIVSIHQTSNADKKDFGILPETINIIRDIARKTKVVVCVFGNPYSLRMLSEFNTVLCGYEDDNAAHKAVASVLYSIRAANGKMPVNTRNNVFLQETGIQQIASDDKLGIGNAFEVGMDEEKLNRIRPLIEKSIGDGEFPGCQILVAKKGKVVYYETYGNLRYGQNEPVGWETIYDLASLTKVSATLQAMMLLYDQNKIDLNQRLAYYLPETDSTNKADMTIRQLLLHEAGLKSFIPFWTYTRNSYGQLNPDMFSPSPSYGLKVANDMYVKPAIKDSVFKWIMASPVNEVKRHVYSDLGMILLQRVIEKIAGMPLDKYCQKNIFTPLQLNNTGFNIYETKNLAVVAPTETEREFRNRALHGTVHDPNAALLGGVAGHAGLFSNAWDLAKILQMNLNGGTYESRKFVSPATIDLFTSSQSGISHRALGWNKPKHDDSGNVSEFASDQAYGHTGYTGTVVWVDPKHDLIFVFLSNRVYPQISNKLIKNKTRKRVHDLVYQAMF
jgi:beta-N-acetylhexosaminidase